MNATPINFHNVMRIILYIVGSCINTLADYQRYAWEKKPGNGERLYTQGLFRYVLHINFSGDSLMFVGFAMITGEVGGFIPVTVIIVNLLLLQIPRLENYLMERYGKEFAEYARETKKFIPFIY